ncbi:hypothetical protein WA026_015111 [Henosepilachna vigintioctopunctata]|uniref:TRAF3-interacting protein 1 n=1 Tax=Henosepilachna vigintioctopunctata TaxID=420089 RepID=A0AAW1TVM1_9CUCU
MSDGIDLNIIKKTQQVLGKHIKKPPLTEKLLSKPPFRFLHDIIVAVIKNTGFLKGIFTQDELTAENVKEREAKIAFLNKLIDAVKITTNTDLKVRATKIVAGLQVNETNLLLQAIAYGIDNKLDTSQYKNEQVKTKKNPIKESKTNKSPKDGKSPKDQKNDGIRSKSKIRDLSKDRKIHSKGGIEKKGKEAKADNSSSRLGKSDVKPKLSKKISENESPPSISKTSIDSLIENQEINKADSSTMILDNSILKNLPKSPIESENKDESTAVLTEETDERPRTRDVQNGYLSKTEKEEMRKSEDILLDRKGVSEEQADVLVLESGINIEPPIARQISARPKSARPKSGELKEKYDKQSENEKAFRQDVSDNIVLQTKTVPRPKSSLRPPSVRPSSARPGAPRLRPDSSIPIQEVVPMGKINVIVENFDKDVDDEETVVIHNAPEETMNMEQTMDLNAKNQSHLVEQILNQIENSEEVAKQNSELHWDHDNHKGRDTTSKEMNQLRNLVQNFTKTANPLGKLLNYLHEDIETMHAELQQWIKTKSQLFLEIEKQEKIKLDMDKPLLEKLERINQDIKKQELEINNVRSNIIQNDIRIKQLVLK